MHSNEIKIGKIQSFWLIFLTSILGLGYVFAYSRGIHGIDNFLYCQQSLKILSGQELGGFFSWPPGCALIMSQVMKIFGCNSLDAGWLLSISSYFGSSLLVGYISQKLCKPYIGLITCMSMFVFNPDVAAFANRPCSELPFIFFSLLPLAALVSLYSTNKRNNYLKLILGLTFALPFWIRYTGILFVLIGIMSLFVLYKNNKLSINLLLFNLSTLFITAGFIPFRNYLHTHTFSGHAVGLHPGQSFISAFVDNWWLIALSLFEPIGISWEFFWRVGFAFIFLFIYILIILTNRHNKTALLIGLIPVFYTTLLSFSASITRIDLMSVRFILPDLPMICLSIGICLSKLLDQHKTPLKITGLAAISIYMSIYMARHGLNYLHFANFKNGNLCGSDNLHLFSFLGISLSCALLGLFAVLYIAKKQYKLEKFSVLSMSKTDLAISAMTVFILSSITNSVYQLNKGIAVYNDNFSPELINYVLKNLPKGSCLAVGRSGEQIWAYSLDYNYLEIPYKDPYNGNYASAYGIQPWTRKEGLDKFIKNKAAYLIFCNGKDSLDVHIENKWYGEYIDALINSQYAEVEWVKKLKDGYIIKLADPDKLIKILNELDINPKQTSN